MTIPIKVSTARSGADGNVAVHIESPALARQVEVGITFDADWVLPDDRCGLLSDLLLISAAVYSIDKLFPRAGADDAWTRTFSVDIGVSNKRIWRKHCGILEDILGFLTGDIWGFRFAQANSFQSRFQSKGIFPLGLFDTPGPKAVCLFSGGLDSLIGAINWLADRDSDSFTRSGR